MGPQHVDDIVVGPLRVEVRFPVEQLARTGETALIARRIAAGDEDRELAGYGSTGAPASVDT